MLENECARKLSVQETQHAEQVSMLRAQITQAESHADEIRSVRIHIPAIAAACPSCASLASLRLYLLWHAQRASHDRLATSFLLSDLRAMRGYRVLTSVTTMMTTTIITSSCSAVVLAHD